MNIGSLYTVKKYYWLLFPAKKTACTPPPPAALATPAAWAADRVAYYSKRFKCNVSYISPSIFCPLEKDGIYCKVLTANGEVGWIYLADWCKDDIEEVKV
jgi:hypothetical protein